MFSSLREKAKEPQGKVPCGGHFRIRQNLPEHAQGWLGSKWLWLLFVIVLYMMLKFRGDSERNKVRRLHFYTMVIPSQISEKHVLVHPTAGLLSVMNLNLELKVPAKRLGQLQMTCYVAHSFSCEVNLFFNPRIDFKNLQNVSGQNYS
jgi:hypothetical protein